MQLYWTFIHLEWNDTTILSNYIFVERFLFLAKIKFHIQFCRTILEYVRLFLSRVTIILFDKESLHFFSLIPYSKLKAVTPSDVWICTPSNFFLLHSSYKKYQQQREVIGLFVVIDLIFVTLLANKGQRIVVTSLWQRKKTYEYFYKTHYIFL